MADTEQAIVQNEKMSVREFAPNTWGGFIGDAMWWMPARADLMPPWGTYECDVALRMMHYTQHNSLVGGATQAYIEKYLSIPYEISGGRNLTFQWQDIFFDAEFGEGYDELVAKGLVDYLTLNRGWFMELVGYGEPDTPLKDGARILGINHLDALRITFTGNREWPYLYQSEYNGKLHKLHATRVIHIARQPTPNTRMFGMGKSALYDLMTVANAEILLGRHENEMLSDLPPTGLVIFNNVKPEEVSQAMAQFDYERVRDGENVYRAPLQLSSKDPGQPATVTFVPMATVPEGFDKAKYTQVHVNLAALNYGLDPQDIWPLSSGSMGSGEQSKVLAAKTDVKGPGYLSTRLTRIWNMMLPRSLEWKYKAANPQQDMQTANIAKTWTDIANASTFMNAEEKRQLVANQVEAFADILMDESGQVRVFDADPKEPAQIVVASDAVQLDTAQPPNSAITANSSTPTAPAAVPDETVQATDAVPVTKDIDSTMSAFIEEMKAAMQDGLDRVTTKAGTAARIRGAITRYGKKAYQDGLEDGGVDPDALDEDDLRLIADYNVWDSQYVSRLVDELFSDGGLKGGVDYRAPLWSSTINRFYYGGIASADKNGMYEFVGDDGVESCDTCKRLKGQVHRMKDWVRKELRPGIDHDNFDCGTWEPHCEHFLEKTTGRARGNW